MHVSTTMVSPLAAAFWPTRRSPDVFRASLLVLLGSVLIAASAQIQVPLWPVPITGQTFAVLVVGMAFGWRLGAVTLLLYIGEGMAGLPVFANFGAGPGILLGPTGGYLIGFVLGAALAGYLAERGWDRGFWLTLSAMILGSFVIVFSGVAWLWVYFAGPGAAQLSATGAGSALAAAIATGMIPFLVGDAVKCIFGTGVIRLARTVSRRR